MKNSDLVIESNKPSSVCPPYKEHCNDFRNQNKTLTSMKSFDETNAVLIEWRCLWPGRSQAINHFRPKMYKFPSSVPGKSKKEKN